MTSRQSLYIGRIFGIPISLDNTWFLIFILVTTLLATSYFPSAFQNWPAYQYWVVGGATSILFFASVLLHELGHSVVALRYKMQVHSITLFIFGGVAQIASEPPFAMAEFWIALAGPLVNFLLAIILTLLEVVFAGSAALLGMTKYLAYINLSLGLFNLVPGFPLDGGRVFRAIIWGVVRDFRRATQIAVLVGRGFAFLFILLGFWQMFTGNVSNGLWIAFVGWFLENAAISQVQHLTIQDLIAGHKVEEAMGRNFTIIPAEITLQKLADDHVLGLGRSFFIVQENDKAVGLLTLQGISKLPRSEWHSIKSSDAMVPAAEMHSVQVGAEIADALTVMDQNGVDQLPIMSGDQVMGILSRDNIINFLRSLQKSKRIFPGNG
jgi:Zn-dependent protease